MPASLTCYYCNEPSWAVYTEPHPTSEPLGGTPRHVCRFCIVTAALSPLLSEKGFSTPATLHEYAEAIKASFGEVDSDVSILRSCRECGEGVEAFGLAQNSEPFARNLIPCCAVCLEAAGKYWQEE